MLLEESFWHYSVIFLGMFMAKVCSLGTTEAGLVLVVGP